LNDNTSWPFETATSGVLAPGRWLWLRAVLWALILASCTLAVFLATQFLGPWLHLPANSSYAIVFLLPIVAFVLYAYSVHKGERRVAREVLPSFAMFRDLIVGALFGFCILCAMIGLLWALGLYHLEWHRWQHIFDAFLFDSYLSGMLEELMFRAILLRILARAFGARWGLVLSSILFGVAHLTHGTWLAALAITINAGLTMGLLYMATGRLWMSVGLHIGWDFTETSILGVDNSNGLLLSTPMSGKSDILTGGSFGPDASVLSYIIGIIAVAAILYARKKGWLIMQQHRGRKAGFTLQEPTTPL
jgi:membrane protease YdiL (CAAX protease family)